MIPIPRARSSDGENRIVIDSDYGRPAVTERGREQQMIALAIDAAEQRIRQGVASDGLLIHYLKLGTEKERLEREKLQAETEMQRAKAEALRETKNLNAMFDEAMTALRTYRGQE